MPPLTAEILRAEAQAFAETESTHPEPTLFGVTDGKAVGTYLEHKFRDHLKAHYQFQEGSSASGIDFPDLAVDMKVTSMRQPQSSCPFKSARQKIYGLGYSLLGISGPRRISLSLRLPRRPSDSGRGPLQPLAASLAGPERIRWRSGIKHDCSKVMEFTSEPEGYRNGLGQLFELEPTYLYPMLKSSSLDKDQVHDSKRWMVVTQRGIGEDTSVIEHMAPKTWRYLLKSCHRRPRRCRRRARLGI